MRHCENFDQEISPACTKKKGAPQRTPNPNRETNPLPEPAAFGQPKKPKVEVWVRASSMLLIWINRGARMGFRWVIPARPNTLPVGFRANNGVVIIHEDTESRPFHILELPLSQRPPEDDANGKDDDHR